MWLLVARDVMLVVRELVVISVFVIRVHQISSLVPGNLVAMVTNLVAMTTLVTNLVAMTTTVLSLSAQVDVARVEFAVVCCDVCIIVIRCVIYIAACFFVFLNSNIFARVVCPIKVLILNRT